MPDFPEQLSFLEATAPDPPTGLRPEAEFIAALSALIPAPTRITLTRNRSALITVRLEKDGVRAVRLQTAFRAADPETMKALARFIHKPDRKSRQRIEAFLRDHQELTEALAREPATGKRLLTRGRCRDLDQVLRKVSREYGLRLPELKITWARRPRRLGRSSIRFGTYNFKSKTVAIHPALDRPEVPDYFVEYIVYHELLHALFPPLPGHRDRETAHSPEFKRFEKKFGQFKEAREFEKGFLKKNLRK